MIEINTIYDVIEITWALSWLGALITIPSVLLQRSGRPAAALTWLLALFALPGIALTVWWVFGRTHLRRKRRRRRHYSQMAAQSLSPMGKQLLDVAEDKVVVELQESYLALKLTAELCDSIFPATSGNKVDSLLNPLLVYSDWEALIHDAVDHLHLLFYSWRDDQIGRTLRDRLIEKAKQGVEVRVLYDAVGSYGLPKRFFDNLTANGGQAVRFMPIRLLSALPTLNFRNHRKLLIADGNKAYTGSINVGDEYLHWQDIGIRIHGPGVNQLQEVFIDDWHFATNEELSERYYFCNLSATKGILGGAVCETIASGPEQAFNTTYEMVFLAITQCRRRIWIITPYFVPDTALLLALRTAVYRGVEVCIMVPGESDAWLVRRASRAYYRELLQSGISVFEYQGMLHAKAIILDDDAILIGSANLDARSFRLNFELSTFVIDDQLNDELAEFFQTLQANAVQQGLEDLGRESTLTRLQDALAHLLSPLL